MNDDFEPADPPDPPSPFASAIQLLICFGVLAFFVWLAFEIGGDPR